jgi:hypothetical protein
MQADAAFATNRFSSSVIVHSTDPDRAAPPYDGSFRSELCLPDRAKEIDFQFDRREEFVRREGACKRYSHRGVSNIAKNSRAASPWDLHAVVRQPTTVARPSATFFASNPISRRIGTSFAFARSLKPGCNGMV